MTEYLSKFEYKDKFEVLPNDIELDARGELRLEKTKIDMVPAGLKGVTFIFFSKKPRYIAPDFDGVILLSNNRSQSVTDMEDLEVKLAKARYVAECEKVEKPRYIKNEDGSLSLCSLPTDMRISRILFEGGYCLDLTRTSVTEKQNLGGFKDIILYPKKPVQQEFPFVLAKKVAHRNCRQTARQITKTYA